MSGTLVNHLVLDIRDVRLAKGAAWDAALREYLNTLCSLIKMNKLYGPVICPGNEHNPGVTGFLLIDTSHIAVHYFSESQSLMIDVCSCKKFDVNTVLGFTSLMFKYQTYEMEVVPRMQVL